MSLNNGISLNMARHMYGRKRSRLTLYLVAGAIIFSIFCLVIVCNAIDNKDDAPVKQETSVTETLFEEITTTQQLEINPTPEPVYEPFYFNVPLNHELQDYIRNLCTEYSVPMELVIAMCDKESSFRASVISYTDDYGLMQINTINHEWLSNELGLTDFLDPFQNVYAGIYILSGHLKSTDGDVVLALMRYNNGATGAKRLWAKGIYSTTYTDRIMEAYSRYQEESRTGAGTLSTANK